MANMPAVHKACSGRWTMILPSFGVDSDILDGRHHGCPTPGCAAQKDGFRMIDIAEGVWICSGKGAEHSGDGFDLIMEVTGLPFGEALRQVCGIVHHAWAGHADIGKYGSKRDRMMMALIDDVMSKEIAKESDDGFEPR